mmetsp:Transcript_8876/g.19075  ORF Transcript_8876/g.19075 Transcript_8876/m.19075 type:complete len:82 (-) Transcript_8876:114-359(-)
MLGYRGRAEGEREDREQDVGSCQLVDGANLACNLGEALSYYVDEIVGLPSEGRLCKELPTGEMSPGDDRRREDERIVPRTC